MSKNSNNLFFIAAIFMTSCADRDSLDFEKDSGPKANTMTFDGRGNTECSFEVGGNPAVCMPSFTRIVALAEQYHGKQVSLKGVLVTGLDGRKVLFRDVGAATIGDLREGILMPPNLEEFASYLELREELNKNQYCRISVSGKFDAFGRTKINSTGAFVDVYNLRLIGCVAPPANVNVHEFISTRLEGF